MSQKCCACEKPSKGAIGSLRYCLACVIELLDWPKRDRRIRFQPIQIQLTDGKKVIGPALWVPDAAISVAKKGAK